MRWKKKICIRITAHRIMTAILVASSSINLIIVGAAFEVVSTITSTPTALTFIPNPTGTFSVPTATFEKPIIPTSSIVETHIPTDSPTITPTFTTTSTSTATSTSTFTATPIQCVPRSYWIAYYVQSGDTLYSLAVLTGSTVDELKLANCLSSTIIYKGQYLYVPRLPIRPTSTRTFTPKPDRPPVVTIISARVNSTYTYDQKLGLWYSYTTLEGNATDPEDGVLPDSSLIWSTDRTDIHQNPYLGAGSLVEAILYSNSCTGVWYTISLIATDSDGISAVASIRIFIGTTLC